jgi:hypothetical protein
MFILSIGAAIPVRAQPPGPGPKFWVDPTSIVWDTNSHSVGQQFTVELKCANMTAAFAPPGGTGLFGYQFTFSWNNAVLNLVNIHDTVPLPPGYFLALNSTAPGTMSFTANSMSTPVDVALATVRTVTLQVIAAPPHILGGSVSSVLHLSDVIFADQQTNVFTAVGIDGLFTFNFVPPPPPDIAAGSKTLSAPGTFDLPITISSYDAVYALTDVHMVLTYDSAIVTATGATAAAWGGIVTVDTSVLGQITIDVASVVPVGSSGIIVNVQMNGFFDPGPGNTVTCALGLTATFNSGTAFDAVTGGVYTLGVPSPAIKAIGINPPLAVVSDEGVVFTVDVLCYNITSVDKFFGAQYTFTYDPTKVQLVSVTEGPFFGLFPWTVPSTWFFVFPAADHFTVAQGLLGGGAEPPGYVFPFTHTPSSDIADGGVLAHVTFKSLSGIPGETVTSAFTISGVVFGDINALEIPVGIVHNGMYSLTLDKRYIDIFTQYPDPYGGQRRFFDSDAFTEQDLVCITAYVTYNGFPVANKLVNFEIHGPPNSVYNITLFYVAITNMTGYATVCFRIDWPADQAETIAFGTWTVEGSVSLDQVLVFDVLHFQVGWLINITKITTNEDAYRHGWHMTIDVYYTSISMQVRPAFFTVTMTDDANYGMGSLTFATTVGYGDGFIEVTCFQIPYWARSGVGTVHGDVFTANPSAPTYGRAYCPEYDQTFGILAL